MDDHDSSRAGFFWPGLLLVLIAALFIPNLILKLPALDIPMTRDLAHQWHPYYTFLRDSYLVERSFPLWNPYDLCGTPFLAFSHSSALYLLNILYLLADFPMAMSLSALLHLIVAGLGCYYLLRVFRTTGPVSFICGLAYSLAGFVFNNINFPPSLYSASWLPLVFLFAVRLGKALKLFDFLLFSLCLAACLYGGDIELAAFGLLVVLALQILMASEGGKGRWRPVLLVVTGIALAGFLFCAQFLPSYQLIHNSIRGAGAGSQIQVSVTIGQALLGILGVIASMFYPFQIGAAGISTLKGMNWFYLGIAPMLGFLIALRRVKQLRKLLWIFVAAMAYAVFSTNAYLHRFIGWVPVLGQSVVPFRAVPALELVFLIIAGAGLDNFLNQKKREFSIPKLLFLPLLIMILFMVNFYADKLHPINGIFIRIFSTVLLLALLFLPRMAVKYLLLALVLVDIYSWSFLHFPRTDFNKFSLHPELEKAVSFTDPKARYLILGNAMDPGLPYSAGMILKAATINGWTRTPIKKYAEVLALVFPEIMAKQNHKLMFYDQMASSSLARTPKSSYYLLSLMNVRWLISRAGIPMAREKLGFVEKGRGNLVIYENPMALERAFLFGKEKLLKSGREVLKEMAKGDFDYRTTVLFSNQDIPVLGPPSNGSEGSGSPGTVSLERPGSQKLSANVNANKSAWLFLSETFDPGWKAFIDDNEVRVFPADYTFQAIPVPAGPHKAKFIYAPVSFEIGLYASLAGALMFVVFLIALAKAGYKNG